VNRKRSILVLGFLVIALLLSGCSGKKVMLSISIQGQGMVTKRPDDQGKGYKKDAVVQLEAITVEGWKFVRWEGDLTGDTPKTSVKMDFNKTVKAVFVKLEYPLEVTVQGEGTVTQEIVTAKGTNYEHGTTVRLTANPATGWRFDHWEGEISGNTNPATIVVDRVKTVKAVFTSIVINDGETVNHYSSIQEAIDAAKEGATIIVSPGTYYENIRFNGKNNITLTSTNPLDPVVVESTIINGNQKGACIVAENGEKDIVISGLTITNGSGRSKDSCTSGGGVYASGSTVTITDSTISGNRAASYGSGGGVCAYSSSIVTITNSTISGNSAYYDGGGVYAYSSTVTITDSTISDNTATSNNGGGVYASVSTVTITNSTISGNSAYYHGGGGVYAYGSTVTITDSTISDNGASSYNNGNGGGVYAYSSSTVTITNSTISGNRASFSGGGVYAYYGSTVTITDSTISGNRASSGGGVHASGSTVTITNSTISDNTASSSGGGIYAYSSSKLNLQGNIIKDNIATTNGGGIWKSVSSTILNLNAQPLTTPAAVEAISEFSNNTPDNIYFE